ncbi:MAG: DNA topoisomerase IB [Dokdonella sp.]|uniref:DNA topoisomerase IB n=1 Tax=Dokdonella sp. TaxID=2291710 RepID=UPI003265BBFC
MATPDPHVGASASSAAIDAAKIVGLTYVSDDQPGIHRRRRGSGFFYLDAHGKRVTDEEVLARIRRLAIPPAYEDVWICASARGHLQATGRDARQRKQYRYHARWHAIRGNGKFTRVAEFGGQLPRLRRRLRRDLGLPGLPREKVLAVAVSVMAETMIRVGNEEYARTNKSYGLTTLRERHVAFLRDGRVRLSFRGKSGQPHDVTVDNARLTRVLRRCQQLPGQALFQYLDDDGARQPIDSGMVNDYLRDAMGGEFTAKDFRTWGGTVRAIALLARTPIPESTGERALAAAIAAVVRNVAESLRNTPAVCRGSYIHPAAFETWRAGRLQRIVSSTAAVHPRQLETASLRLLRTHARTNKSARSGR